MSNGKCERTARPLYQSLIPSWFNALSKLRRLLRKIELMWPKQEGLWVVCALCNAMFFPLRPDAWRLARGIRSVLLFYGHRALDQWSPSWSRAPASMSTADPIKPPRGARRRRLHWRVPLDSGRRQTVVMMCWNGKDKNTCWTFFGSFHFHCKTLKVYDVRNECERYELSLLLFPVFFLKSFSCQMSFFVSPTARWTTLLPQTVLCCPLWAER